MDKFETAILNKNSNAKRKGDLFYWFEDGIYCGIRIRIKPFRDLAFKCKPTFVFEDPRVSGLLSCIWGERLVVCQQPTIEWPFERMLIKPEGEPRLDKYPHESKHGRGLWSFSSLEDQCDASVEEILKVFQNHFPEFKNLVTDKSAVLDFDFLNGGITDCFLPKMSLLNFVYGNIEQALVYREQFKDYESEDHKKVSEFMGAMEYAVSKYKAKVKSTKLKGCHQKR